ncbi:MAG: SpoIIE family protein phosphatase [Chitinispirillia bacterium]|nr:SpoIIE family protein phosphatase [Chitinispirillia bacterium]
MKKRGIKHKILFIVLGMSILSLTAFCAAALWGLFSIRTQMQLSSARLGEFAAKNSSLFLEREAVDKLEAKTKDQSHIINERLLNIAKKAAYLSNYTTNLYNNAANLRPMPIPYPSSKNKGTLTMQLQSAGGRADYPNIKREAGLLGNITSAYTSNIGDMDATTAVYLGTESGFAIIYDSFSDDESHVFDPRGRPWYIGAKKRGDTFWTYPYVDVASGQLTITCSHPFNGADGKFAGVTGMDVVIDDLNNEIINIKAGENGYAFVIDAEGVIISSKELKKNEDGSYEKRNAFVENYPEYNGIIRKMAAGEAGVERTALDGSEIFMAYSHIPATNWSLAIVLPVSEIMGFVAENTSAIESMTQETLDVVNSTIGVTLTAFILVFAAALFVIISLSGKLSDKITRPIVTLKECLRRIAGGELETRIELKTGDEIEELGMSVNKMAVDLRAYIANLQKVTADKERIGAELDVATKIQASMLPCLFPAFPAREEFDIYASMQPAKEVGGDFYDFFLVDEKTLAVVMADVSGKGVPAALFMVIAKTLIKNNAQYGKSPREVFEIVNNLLCENNDAGMFVTAFMGYLDINTGKFTFVNAGHNPPLKRAGDGKYEFLKTKRGLVLAGMDGMSYKQDEITLQNGDELFLYTDGVTEAMNNEHKLFGDPLLVESANKYPGLPLKEFTISIKREIDKFAEGAEQADDITMLALRYHGTDMKGESNG